AGRHDAVRRLRDRRDLRRRGDAVDPAVLRRADGDDDARHLRAGVLALAAGAVQVSFQPNTRYPDPAVEVLDDAFLKLRLYSASVEQLATGLRWAEGPVWFGDGRYLLVSDIPNDRVLRWDEASGATSVFRQPSNNANGHARDRQGRLVSCEHLT